jgi:cation diffusion facilitator family transporter
MTPMNPSKSITPDHDHVFIGAAHRTNERRTWVVIGLTAGMMIVEIAGGLVFGSMALLADGWHMASHAAALSITGLGYFFARRHAADARFSFGTGKIGELAGYSSALLLAGIALLMAYVSIQRLVVPVPISFDQAILVAVLGLIVNLISAWLLKEDQKIQAHEAHHHTDYNLKAAYLHVLADALTSVLAIVALSAGRFLGWVWMDPIMGIVGAIVVARWAYKLTLATGRILLDMNINPSLLAKMREAIESEADSHVTDLHLWRLAPGQFAAILAIVSRNPRPPAYYKERLAKFGTLGHLTVEVNPETATVAGAQKALRGHRDRRD